MIDIAILAANEHLALQKLFKNLIDECGISPKYIYVLFDETKVDDDTLNLPPVYGITNVFLRPLNKDFAAQRNHLRSLCKSDYILYVDADEIIPVKLITTLLTMVTNRTYDIITIPRVNKLICNDSTPATEIFGLEAIDPIDGKIAWPDYQDRFVRNVPSIVWTGALHERLTGGIKSCLAQDETIAIQHLKTTSTQLAQRNFYRDNF